jgi:hypothetical protein
MPEWMIFLVFVMIAVRLGRARRRRCGFSRGMDALRRGEAEHGGTFRPVASRSNPGSAAPGSSAALPVESPVDELKRRYVDGAITVEEYEAELDRLFRSRGRGPAAVM